MTESYYPIVEADGTHRWASVIDECAAFVENDILYEAHDGLVQFDACRQLIYRLYIHPQARTPRLGVIFSVDPQRAEAWAQTWRPA